MVYRDTGRPALAESRLRSAIELASGAEAVLSQAEATRELAILYQAMGRNQEALGSLKHGHTGCSAGSMRAKNLVARRRQSRRARDHVPRGGARVGPVAGIERQLHVRSL